jgi:hypothetical protein
MRICRKGNKMNEEKIILEDKHGVVRKIKQELFDEVLTYVEDYYPRLDWILTEEGGTYEAVVGDVWLVLVESVYHVNFYIYYKDQPWYVTKLDYSNELYCGVKELAKCYPSHRWVEMQRAIKHTFIKEVVRYSPPLKEK